MITIEDFYPLAKKWADHVASHDCADFVNSLELFLHDIQTTQSTVKMIDQDDLRVVIKKFLAMQGGKGMLSDGQIEWLVGELKTFLPLATKHEMVLDNMDEDAGNTKRSRKSFEVICRGGQLSKEKKRIAFIDSFLKGSLRNGWTRVSVVSKEGAEEGISIHQIQRAKNRLGVIVRRSDVPSETKSWLWALPNQAVTLTGNVIQKKKRRDPRKMLAISGVVKITGLSSSTIYLLSKSGKFPAPINIGIHGRRWVTQEIDEWIASRSRIKE